MENLSGEEEEFLQFFRQDLAALCCAGAYVSSEGWPGFVAWLREVSESFKDHNLSPEEMHKSVIRTDRLMMMTHLLRQPDDLHTLESWLGE